VKKLSIGSRLTLWYLVTFATAQFVFGAGMYVVLRHHLVEMVDSNLQGEVEDLRSFLESQKRDADTAKFREEVSESYVQEHAGDYLQVLTAQGELIFRSKFLSESRFEPSSTDVSEGQYQDRSLEDRPLRFLSARVRSHGRVFLVFLGASTSDVQETLKAFLRYLSWLSPLLFLIAALGGHWLSNRALSPVDAIIVASRKISPINLSGRLKKLDTGDELQRLSDTINEMLDRIESAFRRVSEFTADASHELRTPISLIRTEAEVVLRKPRADGAYQLALQNILTEAERITVLLENLLGLARADAADPTLQMRTFDFAGLVQKTALGWEKIAVAKGLLFEARGGFEPRLIVGDEIALRRVLDILLDNAVKYTPAPGRIELASDHTAHHVTVRVRDSGIGIPQEDQAKVFDRFYRVDKARSREMGGAGLGLAIAKWIVEQHGGSISAKSTPGQGSEFSVRLLREGGGTGTPAAS